MDVNDMIRDEDLIMHNSHGNGINQRVYVPHNIQRLVADMVPMSRRPSPRERNLLKRKAKISSKDQMKGWCEDGDPRVSGAQNATTVKGSNADPLGSNKVFVLLILSLLFVLTKMLIPPMLSHGLVLHFHLKALQKY